MISVLDTAELLTTYCIAFGACLVSYMAVSIIFKAVRGRY